MIVSDLALHSGVFVQPHSIPLTHNYAIPINPPRCTAALNDLN